jgi:hypothetical protein
MSFHFVPEYRFPDIVWCSTSGGKLPNAPGNLKFVQQKYGEQDNHQGNADDHPQTFTADLSHNHVLFHMFRETSPADTSRFLLDIGHYFKFPSSRET